jgi:prenyltransferase beta subunit
LKNKYLTLTVFIVLFIIIIGAVPPVLGKTRKNYLTDFIFKSEIKGEGFSEAEDGGFSYEATAYALSILNYYGINPHDKTSLQENLEEKISTILNSEEVSIYNLFYVLKSLKILDYTIDDNLKDRLFKYLNATEQTGGGFAISNVSTSVSLSSTYYIIQMFSLFDESITNITQHKDWVLSCYNIDGGFGGNSSLSSDLVNTFYAISILEYFDSLSDLPDKNQTLTFITSLYVNDIGDLRNFGGFLPDHYASYALLYSTFYSVQSIFLLNQSRLDKVNTVKWVLNHQSLLDGGFLDYTDGFEQRVSSITNSYYAFGTLGIFQSLGSLGEDIGMVEFNYIALIALLISIGLVIGLIYFVWRKRRV